MNARRDQRPPQRGTGFLVVIAEHHERPERRREPGQRRRNHLRARWGRALVVTSEQVAGDQHDIGSRRRHRRHHPFEPRAIGAEIAIMQVAQQHDAHWRRAARPIGQADSGAAQHRVGAAVAHADRDRQQQDQGRDRGDERNRPAHAR